MKEAHRIELIESIEQLSYSTIRIEAKTENERLLDPVFVIELQKICNQDNGFLI